MFVDSRLKNQDYPPNPLRKGLPREKAVMPCVFVIFGGTGDLAHRKLLPSLYHLYRSGLLPRKFAILSYASGDLTDDQYRESIKEAIRSFLPSMSAEDSKWEGFARLLYHCRRTADFAESMLRLKKRLIEIDTIVGAEGNYLFYLAVPPSAFAATARGLHDVGLAQDREGRSWRRLVLEKPFGTDLQSARNLNKELQSIFREEQIYRIDHYLGKETVQNILVFRFANEFVEPLMNSNYVDHIQITVAESIGVEQRGKFYDKTGALRDMVQNHLFQVTSLVCMELPSSLDPEAVREEKTKLLRSIKRIRPEDVTTVTVRGQYAPGVFLGEYVKGYREEDDVAPNSDVETYVALKLNIDNRRWHGVPIYLRTGKRLAKRVSEVAISLRNVPHTLSDDFEIQPNVISLQIQPDEGISVRFQAKVPGLTLNIRPVRMDFKYGAAFASSVPEAYERLLLDAMLGDASLYARDDFVEAAWELVDPIIEGWQLTKMPAHSYLPGSWGPKESDDIMARDGRRWRRL